ncbi:MAG: c-type cytochrome [Luteitalea sp.]|nr:c-type cytochrome [Luteitalea sp.]
MFTYRKRQAASAFTLSFLICWLLSCGGQQRAGSLPAGDPDKGGLRLPDGFEAVVVADDIGPARHLVVNDNGDIYVKLRKSHEEGSLVALRDTTGDGKADVIERFGIFDDIGNFHTGIAIYNGFLYFSTDLAVYRYRLMSGALLPTGEKEVVLIDDHEHGSHEHIAKPLSFDNKGNMYVPFGAPTDACQEPNRTPGVPGLDPCPNLQQHGGIWRFDADTLDQRQRDGYEYATGIRSVVAMDWNPVDEHLYVAMHGRDHLFRLWPEQFSRWQSAILPSEELMRVTDGSDFGWPYCYHDYLQSKKVLAPEYGGDGTIVGRCREFDQPLIGFPGHFAPNGLQFYRGDQFPEHYRNGAFVAFHGSTIRNPYSQGGYSVGFVPFKEHEPSGDWEVFANGFAGVDPIVNTGDAAHRPTGLAVGPDGSLYISDSNRGKIWRVMYKGDRQSFGVAERAAMEEEKRTASNIRTPHEVDDDLEQGITLAGEVIYNRYCAACHQRDGEGAAGRFPPVARSEWVTGDKRRLIDVIINGLDGSITVRDEQYNTPMPEHSFLSDEQVAHVATYVRQNFGNDASALSAEEVAKVRNAQGSTK